MARHTYTINGEEHTTKITPKDLEFIRGWVESDKGPISELAELLPDYSYALVNKYSNLLLEEIEKEREGKREEKVEAVLKNQFDNEIPKGIDHFVVQLRNRNGQSSEMAAWIEKEQLRIGWKQNPISLTSNEELAFAEFMSVRIHRHFSDMESIRTIQQKIIDYIGETKDE